MTMVMLKSVYLFYVYGMPVRIWLSPKYYMQLSKVKFTSGDYDGDGKTDLYVLYDYGKARIGVFTILSSTYHPVRKFVSDKWIFNAGNSRIIAGDFNGDGISDMGALYSYGSGKVGVCFFSNKTSWMPVWLFRTGYYFLNARNLKVADIR